jgi:hypothetical protein
MTLSFEGKEIRALLNNLPSYIGESPAYSSAKKKLERALRPIKVRSAKGKGRELQKWICRKISELLGIPYDQSDDQCLIHSREMGQAGVDIVLRGEALQQFPFSIESKSTESFSLVDAIKQAQNNKVLGTDWLVIHKRKSFNEPVVIMAWSTFAMIVYFHIKHYRE